MTSRQEFSQKRREINEQLEALQGSFILIGLVIGPMLFTLPLIFFSAQFPQLGDPEIWFAEGAAWTQRMLGVIWIILLMVLGVGVPVWLGFVAPEWWWKRYYNKAWNALKKTQLAMLVMNDAGLEPIYELTDQYVWLRWSVAGRPQTMEQHIEFASDYWRCLLALAEGRRERLLRGVIWGNLVRRADDVYPWIFGSCLGPLALMLLVPLFFVSIPLWLLHTALFIQQQAFQAAFYDYFATGRKGISIETKA